MKKLLTAVTAVAMLGLSPVAFAQGGAGGSSSGSSGSSSSGGSGGSSSGGDIGGSGSSHGGSGSMGGSTGGSTGSMGGTTGSMGQTAGAQELEGRVLKASKDQVTIEYQGAAIPFQVKNNTSFQGVKSASQLKEGQQVRANFELSKSNRNELKSIEVVPSGSMGGSTGGSGGLDQGSSGSSQGGSGSTGSQQGQSKDSGSSPY